MTAAAQMKDLIEMIEERSSKDLGAIPLEPQKKVKQVIYNVN